MVNTLTLSSAGGVLLGNEKAPIHIPSHIAPLLSTLPPGEDHVRFVDTGTKFQIHWTLHHNQDNKRRLGVQLWIYEDGSMTIMYQNLLGEMLKLAESQTEYPVIIGLQEGWAVPPMDDGKGTCIMPASEVARFYTVGCTISQKCN